MTYAEQLAREFVGPEWDTLSVQQQAAFVENAAAWLAAIAALAERGGPKLVARETTEGMCIAGWIDKEDVDPADIWRAMHDAARAVPGESE